MTKRLVSLKHLFVGLALVAALGVSTAFAATPTIRDAGSAYWTAPVSGSGFSSSGYWGTRYADVWAFRDGRWVAVAAQLTSVARP